MTKRKPKRKPRLNSFGRALKKFHEAVPPESIPNAEEVAQCLGSVTTETSGAGTSNVEIRVKYKSPAQIAEELALERGRTIRAHRGHREQAVLRRERQALRP